MNAIIGLGFCILLAVSIRAGGITALLWFPAGFVVGLFVTAQILLPIVLGLPRAARLVSRREMRAGVFVRILLTALVWFTVLFAVLFLPGFFWPSAADFLYRNLPLNWGVWAGTVAILISPLSAKCRADFRADFEKSYQKFFTSPNAPEPTATADSDRYGAIVSAFIDLTGDHRPPIGDASLLPYPKKTTLYAIAWVRAEFQEKSEATADESVRNKCNDTINTLNFLLTRLAHDWQPIAPEDKEAVAKLRELESLPDWALPLKTKYLNDNTAAEEACEATLQVTIDRTHGTGLNT